MAFTNTNGCLKKNSGTASKEKKEVAAMFAARPVRLASVEHLASSDWLLGSTCEVCPVPWALWKWRRIGWDRRGKVGPCRWADRSQGRRDKRIRKEGDHPYPVFPTTPCQTETGQRRWAEVSRWPCVCVIDMDFFSYLGTEFHLKFTKSAQREHKLVSQIQTLL